MALEIVWSEEADEPLDEIIEHLEKHWTEREITSFFTRLEEGLEAKKSAPHRYKDSLRKPNTKEFILSPQTTIFYTYDSKYLYILLLWVNKKDPENLIKQIEKY